ncbi:MAG: response regulator transcription factor [Candidatus Binatia bacterium]
MTRDRVVYVVEDDDAVRDALAMLFRTASLKVEAYPSAEAFLQCVRWRPPACLVLDIRMPGMSGLALQSELVRRGSRLPILFVTGHGDVPMAVDAVQKGAFDFIEKPFDEARLLDRVREALDRSEGAGVQEAPNREWLSLLSDREHEVLERVLEAKSSRRIAEELFISVKTVEFHRANIMRKAGVHTSAELLRLCLQNGEPNPARATRQN